MRVGDIVKLRSNDNIGLVVEKYRRTEQDGNPNGDFYVYYHYRVLFGSSSVMIRNGDSLKVVNEAR